MFFKDFFFSFMKIYLQTKKYLRAIITTRKMLQLYYSAAKMILIQKQMNHGFALDSVIFILGRYVCHKN